MSEYSIHKCIRTDKPIKQNGKYPICLRIRVKGKETKLTTSLDVALDKWDTQKKEPKDKFLLARLNKKIADLETQINRVLMDGQKLTIELVKELYSGKRQVEPEEQDFYEYYLAFVKRKAKQENLNEETIKVYKTTYKILKKFRPEFKISDINLKFVEDFDDFMRDVRGNANGGRNPKHKNLRSVIIDMVKHDINIKNPYAHFKIPQPDVKEIYLEKDELLKMKELEQKLRTSQPTVNEHNTTEGKVLRIYLFSCYCGLRFSDIMELKWKHIDLENNLVVKIMKKTKTEVKAPIPQFARTLLLLMSDSKKLIGSDKLVFETLAEPTVNKTLKKVAKKLGINKHLTFHTARHTFATLLVIEGLSIYEIQKFLGHKSVTTTERYLKYDLKIATESVGKIKTFSNNS